MKLSKNGKRMGRPPMVKTQPTQRAISIKEASDVLSYLVKDVKGLDISFFNTSNKVNIGWRDEVFEADNLNSSGLPDQISKRKLAKILK